MSALLLFQRSNELTFASELLDCAQSSKVSTIVIIIG